MKKILFFVTIQEIIPIVKEEAAKAGLDVTVRLWTKNEDMLPIAYMEANYDAVVCRGNMYKKLESQMLSIPVICCPSTVGELLVSVRAVKKELNLPRPRLYRLGSVYSSVSAELVSELTETEFHYRNVDVNKKSTVIEATMEAQAHGAQAVICGPALEKIIQEAEIPVRTISCGLVNSFSAESIALGLSTAKYSITSAENRQKKNEVMENIIQYSFDAVILLDKQRRILLVNTAAEEMFGIKSADCCGVEFFEQFPQFYSHIRFEPITEERELFGRKILTDGTEYINNIICVPVLDGKDGSQDFQYVLYFRKLETMERLQNSAYANTERFVNEARYVFEDIIGESSAMKAVVFKARRFAQYDATVMIRGESGTGKELFAQSIHNASSRSKNRFVALNCAAMPTNLLESELFGYTKGAFTGSLREGKKGLFEIADHGTLFLDEITEMDLSGQQKLLRVLAEQKVRRIGDDVPRSIDVRIIAATNKNILEQIRKGRFLEDLFYRLDVLSLRIPPLRERKEDIRLLTDYYVSKFRSKFQRNIMLEEGVYRELEQLSWFGNVRQLRNFCERLVIVAEQRRVTGDMVHSLLMEDYYYLWEEEKQSQEPPVVSDKDKEEREQILAALNQCGGAREAAARQLGISPSTLYRKMKKYKITLQAN